MGDGTTTTNGSVNVGVESTGGTTNVKENTTNTTTTTNVENNKETTKETKTNNVSVNKDLEQNKETKEDSNSSVNESVEHEKRYNELNTKYETTMKELQGLKVENAVIRLGHENGLDNKTITLFRNTIKNENVIDSKGNIKEELVKKEIENFLNDFPMLRQSKKTNYVKIGAEVQKEDSTKSFQDELDKAFRIK